MLMLSLEVRVGAGQMQTRHHAGADGVLAASRWGSVRPTVEKRLPAMDGVTIPCDSRSEVFRGSQSKAGRVGDGCVVREGIWPG